ncbi:MAG: hypothetical protein ACR2QM_11405 [Longimicrobiales bacterium]
MTSFEYLSVLVSIVLALGITHILTGLSSILRSEGKVRLCWIQLSWCLVTLALQVSVWWRYWEFRSRETWGLFEFLSLLVVPALAYLAAFIIMPDVIRDDSYDLRAHFDQVRQEFFGTLFIALVFSPVSRALFFDQPLLSLQFAPIAVLALMVPTGAFIADRRWQGGLVLSVIGVWILSVLFVWEDLRQVI